MVDVEWEIKWNTLFKQRNKIQTYHIYSVDFSSLIKLCTEYYTSTHFLYFLNKIHTIPEDIAQIYGVYDIDVIRALILRYFHFVDVIIDLMPMYDFHSSTSNIIHSIAFPSFRNKENLISSSSYMYVTSFVSLFIFPYTSSVMFKYHIYKIVTYCRLKSG